MQPLCRLRGPRVAPRDRKDTNIAGAPPHTVDAALRVHVRQPIDKSDHGRSQIGTASGPESPSAAVVGCDGTVPTQIVQLLLGALPLAAVPDQPVADVLTIVIVTVALAL